AISWASWHLIDSPRIFAEGDPMPHREETPHMVRELTHFVGGAAVAGTSGRFGDVFDPSTGEVQARVPLASTAEVTAVIDNAAAAQLEWATWNPQRRARVLLKFLALVERDMDS